MIFDVDLETLQTVAFGLAMISLGVWFGSRVTGQLALQEQNVLFEQPEWVGTVQTIHQGVLAVFVLCMAGVLVADYLSRTEEERPSFEALGLR